MEPNFVMALYTGISGVEKAKKEFMEIAWAIVRDPLSLLVSPDTHLKYISVEDILRNEGEVAERLYSNYIQYAKIVYEGAYSQKDIDSQLSEQKERAKYNSFAIFARALLFDLSISEDEESKSLAVHFMFNSLKELSKKEKRYSGVKMIQPLFDLYSKISLTREWQEYESSLPYSHQICEVGLCVDNPKYKLARDALMSKLIEVMSEYVPAVIDTTNIY